MTKVYSIPIFAKIGYASGNFGKSLQWNTVEFIYLYFLTDLVGLSPALSGLVILLSLIWDSLSDPLVGYLVDRNMRKIGSYQRMIIYCAPIAGLGFVLIFILPLTGPGSALFWALLAGLLFRTGYTLVDVPHNAMLAGLTGDSRERSSLSAYRFLFSSLGSIILSVAVMPALVSAEKVGVRPLIVFALASTVLYLAVMWISSASYRPQRQLPILTSRGVHLRQAIRDLAANREFVWVLLSFALTALLVPMFAKMAIFYANSWLGSPASATILIIAYSVGQIVSLPFWLSLSHLTQKRFAAIIANLVFGLACLVFLVLTPLSVLVTAIVFAMAGFSFAGINIMNWAMIPDTIDHTQRRSGARYEALTFGLLLMVIKISAGFSTALIGFALHLIGYDPEHNGNGDALVGIPVIMVALPLLGVVLCGLTLTRVRLVHDRLE